MPDTHTRTQHTPGPWYHSCDDGNHSCNVNTAAGVIADLEDDDRNPTPEWFAIRCANARLIAAAPLMADAILAAIRYGDFSDSTETMDMLKNAARTAGLMP